jgi:hypothetical protein
MGVWSGTVRIDIAVLNGEMAGFEIKSDRDTLTRLPFQVEIYSKVFDKLTLVVGKRHEHKAAEMVPKWWGITVASVQENEIILRHRRAPKQNRFVDKSVLCQQLWKNEVLELLDRYDTSKGWQSKNRRQVYDRLLQVVPDHVFKDEIRETLKRRDNWLG